MTALQSVEDLEPDRISVENCGLTEESRGLLAELIEKHVPGISQVTLRTHSASHFTLSVKFSPEVSDKITILNNMLKKLQDFIADKNAKFNIHLRKPIEHKHGYTIAHGTEAVASEYAEPPRLHTVQSNPLSTVLDLSARAILTTMGAVANRLRMF